MTLAFPVTAAVLAAGCGWPASAVISAYTVPAGTAPGDRPRLSASRLAPLLAAVPMVTLVFAAAWWVHPALVACAACWLVVCGVPLAAIDASVRRLPDVLTGAAFAGTAALLLAAAAYSGRWPDLARASAGAGVVAGLFLILAVARPGSAGLGDAKLGLSIGALAGWLGWGVLVSALFAGFLLAACYGLWLIGFRKASLRSSVPFGPFLLAGCVAAVLLASAGGSA
jgi:leader peptidase (prepilin peptidase) / N-methyltransferase